ncbi:hypothetical protein [Luteococcus peritonei]|uniref:TetR/AcrR family transcriptional regulator n=1 Tax=Luteococcus peritonei TaxID=88874 RepID=A0ABW4RY51_9ACTN
MARKTPSRPRLSEQETRTRLLDLASATLAEQGLTVGLDAIRMEKLIGEAGVSRASAYRCWPHREDFLSDALVATLRQTTLLPEGESEIVRLVQVLEQHRSGLASEQGRRDLVVEALRVSLDADLRRLLASPRWRFFMALSATHQTLPDEQLRATVATALAELETAFETRRAEVYGGLLELIGYRQREPWSGHEGLLALAQQTGLVMRGAISRALVDPDWLDRRRALRLFGSRREADWSQPEIALCQALLGHLEPDPDVVWDEAQIAAAERRFTELAHSLGTEVQLG